MKNIITSIILLITISVNAQTKLDSLLLSKVNEYRLSKGLHEVDFDIVCFKSADNQVTYCSNKSTLGVTLLSHSQSNPKYESLSKRYTAFGGLKRVDIGEICSFVNMNARVSDTLYLDKMANLILDTFIHSVEHNEIMIDPKYKNVGISTKTKKISTGTKYWNHYDVFTTMVFSAK